MYGVMIVDDEAPIREWIKSLIPWQALGLRLSAEAGDSDTAWESFQAQRPKIVITDVNIPFISGLELARKIAALDPDVRFIVITGYFDFNAVQDSVKLGAVDLISKPIVPEELTQSLQKCIAYFSARIQEQRRSETLCAMLAESRGMLMEKYCSRLLLSASEAQRASMAEKLAALRAPFSGRCSVALLSPSASDECGLDTVMIAAKNIADELIVKAGFRCYSYYNDFSVLICIVSWPEGAQAGQLEQALVSVAENMSFYFGAAVSTGVGVAVDSPCGLHESYLTAERALDWVISNPQEPVVNYRDVERLSHLSRWQETPAIRALPACLQSGRTDQLQKLLAQQFSSFTQESGAAQAREFSLSFLVSLIAAGTALSSDYSWILPCVNHIPQITESRQPAALQKLIFSEAERLIRRLKAREDANKSALILSAQRYIDQHLDDPDLSLDQVSRHVGFSGTYFCRLFHQEMQISFNDYLNRMRVERAKELLHTPSLRISEVSRLSGYNTPTHFNYMFKRLAGVTPSEYKSAILKR